MTVLLIGTEPKEYLKTSGNLTGLAAVRTTAGIVAFNFNTTLAIITLLALVRAVARVIFDTAKQ